MADSDNDNSICAIQITKKGNQKYVGAAVRTRLRRKGLDDQITWSLELFDFLDNDQLTNLDCLLTQLGDSSVILPDDLESSSEWKKTRHVFNDHMLTNFTVVKKSTFKKAGAASLLLKLTGVETHLTNSAEVERPLAMGCFAAINTHFGFASNEECLGKYLLKFGSLNRYMRIDSSAASAINLFSKPNDPSPYGSVYGILNRCKTKMGQRLLDRWLRHPLLDVAEISSRQDLVELLKDSVLGRNRLVDGSLKGIPDIDSIITRIQKPSSDLTEVYRLYVFARSLPNIISALRELILETDRSQNDKIDLATERYLNPLVSLDEKLDMFRQLVEHVVDFDRLPDVIISAKHDASLLEMSEEMKTLENRARRLQEDANRSWGSFTDVKLELNNSQWGFIFRTTKGDDERDLRANNSQIRIVSLQKNGLHFTTPQLSDLAESYAALDAEYRKQQADLVKSAVETAVTYLPLLEAACSLVAEIDVLASFATVAALSSEPYERGEVSSPSDREIFLQDARHPCVELMDGVEFIPNSYDMKTGKSNFQIVTGPNMGGKSTFIRALGSIVCMAQVGSFVPASVARVAVVDSILARVGAGDAGQKGISTFMAEMLEASVLLETATANSLVIIDELGRGTSTFDGFGLAWAISEYITTRINCFCLFATHFHELTTLAKHKDNVVNKHVTAQVENMEVIMLHRVMDGPCSESFGVHVAAMAGFPPSVIREAKRKSDQLEDPETHGATKDPLKMARIERAMEKFASLPFDRASVQEATGWIDTLKGEDFSVV